MSVDAGGKKHQGKTAASGRFLLFLFFDAKEKESQGGCPGPNALLTQLCGMGDGRLKAEAWPQIQQEAMATSGHGTRVMEMAQG